MTTMKIVRRLALGCTLIVALSAGSCLKNMISVAERDPGCAHDATRSSALQANADCRDTPEINK
jgi:hypothetical protein